MTPDGLITYYSNVIERFDEIACVSIVDKVDIDFFKERFLSAWDDRKTITGKPINYTHFVVDSKPYSKTYHLYEATHDKLQVSDNHPEHPNPHSFRKSIDFDGFKYIDNYVEITDYASYKGEEYGSKVIKDYENDGIDIFDYENKTDDEKNIFLSAFIESMKEIIS